MDERELLTFADKFLKQNVMGIDYDNLTPAELAGAFEERAKAIDTKVTRDRNIAINSFIDSIEGYLE